MDDIASRYESGESAKDIAKSLGVHVATVYNRLKRTGLKPVSRLYRTVDNAEIARLYVSGVSELAISKMFGIARTAIRARLLKAGIVIRTASEANVIRMARLSPDERQLLTANAHAAVTGSAKGEQACCQAALTRERKQLGISPAEIHLANILRGRGLSVSPQKAVGRFNVDIALDASRIAVEIFGGHWHATGRHAARHNRRVEYILNRGWRLLIIWVTPDYPLSLAAINYIVSLTQEPGGDESARGEHHVIRGDGEPCAIGQRNFDNYSRISRLCSRQDTV